MSFIASKAYILDNGIDYTPGIVGGPIDIDDSWIMNIHVIKALTDDVTIVTHRGTTILFPKGSLQVGAIYPYSVKSVVLAGGDTKNILGLAPGYKVVLF